MYRRLVALAALVLLAGCGPVNPPDTIPAGPASPSAVSSPSVTPSVVPPPTVAVPPVAAPAPATTDPTATDPTATDPTATDPTATGATADSGGCARDEYRNVDGVCVHRPESAAAPPAGATALCNDGTYSFSQHRSGTCSHHGGVRRWL